jgi:hypothetical protein
MDRRRQIRMAEAGTTYQELRGVSLECDAELVRDRDPPPYPLVP